MNITGSAQEMRPWVMTVSILIIVNCLALIPSMAYTPLIPAIKNATGMNFSQLGFFTGMAGILSIICSVPAGMAIRRFGARRVFLSAICFVIAGLFILSFASNFTGAISGRGVWQIGLRFLLPALTAATVVTVPDKYRSTTLGISIAVSMLGTIAGTNAGAWIGDTGGWQLAIQFFAAIVLVAGIIFFIFYRGHATTEGETLRNDKVLLKPGETKPKSIYTMPSVWMLCLMVIFGCEEGVIDSFAVVQMADIWKTSAKEFALIISIGQFIAMFVNLVAGWCGDKFGRWNMLIVSNILNTLVGVCLLIGQFDHKEIYIAGILIAKTLQLTTSLFANSMAPTFLKGRDVAGVIAMIALGIGLGQYLGQQTIGILRDLTRSYTAGWIYIAASGAAAAVFAFGFKIYYERKEKSEAAGCTV
jgi:MFS transporter, FSR family, fosmidomycin resistance protein